MVDKAAAYKRWFHIKVRASLDDPHPNTPHDHQMVDTEAINRAA